MHHQATPNLITPRPQRAVHQVQPTPYLLSHLYLHYLVQVVVYRMADTLPTREVSVVHSGCQVFPEQNLRLHQARLKVELDIEFLELRFVVFVFYAFCLAFRISILLLSGRRYLMYDRFILHPGCVLMEYHSRTDMRRLVGVLIGL